MVYNPYDLFVFTNDADYECFVEAANLYILYKQV